MAMDFSTSLSLSPADKISQVNWFRKWLRKTTLPSRKEWFEFRTLASITFLFWCGENVLQWQEKGRGRNFFSPMRNSHCGKHWKIQICSSRSRPPRSPRRPSIPAFLSLRPTEASGFVLVETRSGHWHNSILFFFQRNDVYLLVGQVLTKYVTQQNGELLSSSVP